MRYAQILYNKAHWIFETDGRPEFASNIVLVDITDKPAVQEGWDYDAEKGEFTEHMPVEPEPQPPSEIEGLTNYVLDVDYRLIMVEMGLM